MRSSRFHHAPPWWPEGESWPPPDRTRWHRRRRRFLAKVALVGILVVSLSAYGAIALIRTIAGADSSLVAISSLAWLVVPLLVVGFAVAMRLVGRPLGEVVGAAERVASGDFAVRVAEHGPPSLRSVASAFNSMTTRLAEQQQARRDLMADIAHELRTPLSVMQGRLEGMLDGVYPRDEHQMAQVLEDTRTLSRLVEDLRTLAHSESGTLNLVKEPTDVHGLLNETVSAFQPEARVHDVRVEATVAGEVPTVDIDALRIREVLMNLLVNAVRHSPKGAVVEVSAAANPRDVVVRVADRGPGIAPDDLPHVFDRFYKGNGSMGSGLGLTIARNLVAAHGGTIDAQSPTDGGTVVEFTLPRTHD
jgi:signal transduction histidine kinase